MLNFISKSIGQFAKEVVNVGDAIVDAVKDVPDAMSKGYDEGIFTQTEAEEPAEADAVTPGQTDEPIKAT